MGRRITPCADAGIGAPATTRSDFGCSSVVDRVVCSVVPVAMDLDKLRKLLSLDPNDPLSRFALGRKLAEMGEHAEAGVHLRFASAAAPAHLATYRVLAETLIALGEREEARKLLTIGIEKVRGVGEGMGRELGPIMQKMLDTL